MHGAAAASAAALRAMGNIFIIRSPPDSKDARHAPSPTTGALTACRDVEALLRPEAKLPLDLLPFFRNSPARNHLDQSCSFAPCARWFRERTVVPPRF